MKVQKYLESTTFTMNDSIYTIKIKILDGENMFYESDNIDTDEDCTSLIDILDVPTGLLNRKIDSFHIEMEMIGDDLLGLTILIFI